MIGRFPILYIAEADAEQAVLSSGVLSHLVESLPNAAFTIVGSAASVQPRTALASVPVFGEMERFTLDLGHRASRSGPIAVFIAVAAKSHVDVLIGGEKPGCRGMSGCPIGAVC